jgi:hypothetical protein
MDDEIKGDGNSVNYKFRMHDPRIGRFFSVDPLFKDFPSNSSYAFSENNVIHAVELEGLEKVHVYNKWMDSKGDMQSKYSHTYIDKRLKENINQVNSYNAKGDIASKTYKSNNTSVTIKAGTEYKNDFTQFFDSEKSGFTSIDTRSMPDAMRHDSWEGGDDGANTGNNAAGEQAPTAVKVLVGLNPIISIYNGITVLTTNKDIYGVESSTKADKAFAILDIFSGFGGFTSIAKAAKATTETIKNAQKVDKVVDVIGISEDAGAFDKIK